MIGDTTNGYNGILVPVGNEKVLAGTITDLFKNEELRKHLSERGKERAEDFGIEKILPQYRKVFFG